MNKTSGSSQRDQTGTRTSATLRSRQDGAPRHAQLLWRGGCSRASNLNTYLASTILDTEAGAARVTPCRARAELQVIGAFGVLRQSGSAGVVRASRRRKVSGAGARKGRRQAGDVSAGIV